MTKKKFGSRNVRLLSSRKDAPKKCKSCGKTPEQFYIQADGYLFCNAACLQTFRVEGAKGTQRFNAEVKK